MVAEQFCEMCGGGIERYDERFVVPCGDSDFAFADFSISEVSGAFYAVEH